MSGYITNTELIKKLGNIVNVPDAKIEVHLPVAKYDVINIIGEDKYNELQALNTGAADRELAESGEGYMALAYIFPAINKNSNGQGVTKSTGFKDSRVDNLSEADVQMVADGYREIAERILSKFKKKVLTDGNINSVNSGSVKFISI